MSSSAQFLNPSEAARRLGVSTKALRLYEERGLLTPVRTAAGWRAYGPEELARAAEIAALRSLGLSLAEVGRVLDGDPRSLEPALATHEAALQAQVVRLGETIARVRALRGEIADGKAPAMEDLSRLLDPAGRTSVAFDLPWPWGGERFELRDLRPITYIIGPLGSGKTRLAQRLAETLPNAAYLGLERLSDDGATARATLDADPTLRRRVEHRLALLVDEGATVSPALVALLVGLEREGPASLVIDMVEDGLEQATQEALIAHLRRQAPVGRPLILMTRSRAILDLEAVGVNEAIILCPANHAPPSLVDPYPGAPGYEAVATCLAWPEVRARTAGVIAWRAQPA
ncbi:MerR family transcriptional regulator [Kaistia dalseonensis]|uniref:DNA-binding transcriptional MerR regulator n=1 Tax=Kaistia dalseonensis TaxID=410840 RepID=A0ABU0H4J1_9HYPH|nr:MerR family transcriptional regulator [Kaistia dalseonensis]MCX5494645.1 MerR family transcriptional regulator [Kaistia dalseonensis]MDQ0437225.1 DNA-binding transcriptional MerR regulator [Kaistia dalseonensis]